jgi:hypothetical protein
MPQSDDEIAKQLHDLDYVIQKVRKHHSKCRQRALNNANPMLKILSLCSLPKMFALNAEGRESLRHSLIRMQSLHRSINPLQPRFKHA